MSGNRKKFYKKNNKGPSSSKSKIEEVKKYEISSCHGYDGYQLYFGENDKEIKEILQHTQSFELYLHRNIAKYNLINVRNIKAFNVDLKELYKDEQLSKEWDGFKSDVAEKTEHTLLCMGMAMHQILVKEEDKKHEAEGATKVSNSIPIIRCRLLNHEPILNIKNLGVSSFGKLVSIRGTLIKASTEKLQCSYLTFQCGFCGGTQVVKQPDGVHVAPTKCLTKNCRVVSKFIPLLSSPHTRVIKMQSLKVQEIIGDERDESGRVPKTVECELAEDLVGSCVPGDDIIITGIVKVHDEVDGHKERKAKMYLLYLDAVAVVNERSRSNQGITFDTRDYYLIEKIHGTPNKLFLLVHSLCPNIFGQEIVKAGLILALFGGTENEINRSDCHVLIVGDPGLGKSQMLQACCNVAPRGVYICGNTSTVSGMTVTMTREGGGDFALEAGALVLADRGCCCIDEFDKMSAQHQCLLEVMEQQSISVAKAGVHCCLPARPSILAAANPIGGHYNKAKTVAENLKISSPLLSRFDLVFILLDKPDEQRDLLLSEHILDINGTRRGSVNSVGTNRSSTKENLSKRLMLQAGESVDHLPHQLFRKYIAYARKYVHPQLNVPAQKILKEFYMDLRRQSHKEDSTPITTRQLFSLIRLTQARAKLDLREEATADDAKDVIEIMKNSLCDVFSDGKGHMDFTRSQNGSGITNRKMINKYLSVLKHKSEILCRSIFTLEELKELYSQLGLDTAQFRSALDSLNIQGFLLIKGNNRFQLTIGE